MRLPIALALIALSGSPVAMGGHAAAQVVSPMKMETQTLSDAATARFEVANPYKHAQTSEFFMVDDSGRPIPGAQVSPSRRLMASGGRAPLMVRVPLQGRDARRVYVCHAITPRQPNRVATGTTYRGEVCAMLDISRQSR